MRWIFGDWKKSTWRATLARMLALSAASAAASCAGKPEEAIETTTVERDLAALMIDGKLPNEMMPPATVPPPPAPARFCPPPTLPGVDGGVAEPPTGVAGPELPIPIPTPGRGPVPIPDLRGGVSGAGGATAADGGVAPGPDPNCASVPIGFWRFDDCNSFRSDLNDSSFQGHTAFRSVDLTCAAGQQGLAASFVHEEDLVHVPDQPTFALDFGVTIAAWVRPDSVTGDRTLFRKRDDANSAFALVIHNRRYQFVVRLASGQLATVSAPARAGEWTHVAATYDDTTLRLYLNGVETNRTQASGVIARGMGPLLIGNDGSGRRFRGRIDNAWFNTQAASAEAVSELLCLRHDPMVSVSPRIGPPVAPGTPVTYTLSVANVNDARCPPAVYSTFASAPQADFVVEPSLVDFSLATGELRTLDVSVQSGVDAEPDTYPISFTVSSQDNGGSFFPGFPPDFAPSVGFAGTGATVVVPEAVADEEPIPPGPTGFVEVKADYVVAEPTGCHVSSQRALMIRHITVVDDPVRTSLNGPTDDPNTGAWSFGGLMQRLSPTAADAADNTEAMFQTFLSTQTINGFAVEPRPGMDTLVLASWPRRQDGKLDLARAPLRLLAITHRLDLVDLANGKGGEGRFTYGVLDPNGFPLEFTVIFEYLLAASDADEYRAWVDAVHALQDLPFPSEEYNQALQAVTDRFTGRDALPGAPNGSALIDIRTNEISLSLDGQWQLREFRIAPESGFMAPNPLFQTPDASFNFDPALSRFIQENEASILLETHEAPLLFEENAFQAGAVFNNIDFWSAPDIVNPEARHKFSLNTCNGCHGGETSTAFLHVFPRQAGEQSPLSGFLTGITVTDPVTQKERRLSELARRRALLETLVCEGAP